MNDEKIREMMAPPAADINSVRQVAEAPMPRRMSEKEYPQGKFDTMMEPLAADIEERNHTR